VPRNEPSRDTWWMVSRIAAWSTIGLSVLILGPRNLMPVWAPGEPRYFVHWSPSVWAVMPTEVPDAPR